MMKLIKTLIWITIAGLISVGCQALDTLTFREKGFENRLSLADIRSRLTSHIISIYDPYYLKNKKYRAFQLDEVLQLGFQKQPKLLDIHDFVTFHALDGYNPTMDLKRSGTKGGWIAVEDLSWPTGWEPRGGATDLGPFYIVWEGDNQRLETGYPWPAKTVTIELTSFEQSYGNIQPHGVTEDSDVYKGYELFRSRCLVCHALNKQGGDKGPDLLAPKAIGTYRTRMFLKAYIKKPSDYRYTKMPDNPDLSDSEVETIIEYLEHQAQLKQDR